MNKSIIPLALCASLAWAACGGSIPPPTQRLADAEAAERSAGELGAANEPAAKLSLQLAQEQISQAKVAMADGDNEQADRLLVRATADAELAVAQAKETGAKAQKAEAVEDSAAQKETNVGQGAVK